jgi:Caudovirus prohead serine protease
MPWTAADAKGHTKKADTKAKQEKWAKIANATLKETGDEGEAVATANKAMDRCDDDGESRMIENIGPRGSIGAPGPDGPRGSWNPGIIQTRLASIAPKTFSKAERSVDAVLSRGSPVERFYGTESLRIHKDAVILDRLKSGGIPVLDSHRQDSITSALGRVREAWIDRGPSLMGRMTFNETEFGERAMGMVSRGEISAVSAGYNVRQWEIRDSDGNIVDPEKERVRWDEKLSFEARSWEVLEASLVACPADASAVIRTIDLAFNATSIFRSGDDVATIRARALARQRMTTRTASLR